MMEVEQRRTLETILKRPGFTLQCDGDAQNRRALDEMMLELTEDLDRMGRSQADKLG